MSPRSQEALFKALEVLEFPAGARPSLFLTDDGHYELAWKDQNGCAVQLEFGPSEFEIFIEASGIEESLPNQLLGETITKHLVAA